MTLNSLPTASKLPPLALYSFLVLFCACIQAHPNQPSLLLTQSGVVIDAIVKAKRYVALPALPDQYNTLYKLCSTNALAGSYQADCIELGAIGGLTSRISDMPRLKVGSRYIIYVNKQSSYDTAFMGLTHGVLEVRTDADNVERVFTYNGKPTGLVPGCGPVSRTKPTMTLEEFKRELGRCVKERKEKGQVVPDKLPVGWKWRYH